MENKYENLLLKGIKIGVILILFTPLVLGPLGLSLSNYPKTVFFRTITEIIFIFYLLLIFRDSRYLPKISPLVLVLISFSGVLILTSLTGINFQRSLWGELFRVEGVIFHLHLLVLFLILISVFHKKEEWLKLFKLTVIVSAISSLAGILQQLGAFSFYGINLPERISGTWTNPDFFGPYIVLNIFLSLFLLKSAKEKNWKITWASILALNCFTLILSGTRAAWIGFGAGMTFLFLFWFFGYAKLNQKTRKRVLLGVLVLSIFLLLIVLNQEQLSLNDNALFQRAFSVFDIKSLSGRLQAWELAFDAWKDKPILGWGPESFSFLFDKYFKADYLQSFGEKLYYDRPHNKVMGVMATTGLLGLLSYLAIFSVVFYLLFSHLRRFTNSKKKNNKSFGINPFLSLILIAFFISYFVQNLFAFDTIGTYLIFCLVLGFINNNVGKQEKRKERKPIKPLFSKTSKNPFRTVIKIGLIFPLIFLSLIVFYQLNFKPTAACFAFLKGAKLEARNFDEALSNYKKAVSKNTIFDKDFKKEVIVRLVYILENGKVSEAQEREIIETLSTFKPFLEEALKEPDRRYLELYELAARINERIYLFSGDLEALEKMEEISKRALDFNDQKPEFYRLMGKVKIFQNNYSEGEAFFQKSFELGGNKGPKKTINLYKYLGGAYLKAGDKTKAVENLKKALDIEFCLEKLNPTSSENSAQRIRGFAQALAGMYYQDFNDLETCRQIYEKTMELFPDHKRQLRFNLEMLIE